MNLWISIRPSRKRRFEIRSVWSTKRNGSQFGCRFALLEADSVPLALPASYCSSNPRIILPISAFGYSAILLIVCNDKSKFNSLEFYCSRSIIIPETPLASFPSPS